MSSGYCTKLGTEHCSIIRIVLCGTTFTLLKKRCQCFVDAPMLRSHRRQRPLTDNKEKPQPHCAPPTDKNEASTLELLCEHLLIYIFALATMYCDQTTSNISAVCRRFNYLVKTQQFQNKQFQEWLSAVADWSTKTKHTEKNFFTQGSFL